MAEPEDGRAKPNDGAPCPWGKPWQNLRSTRETELVETFPVHVAAAWLGNTEAVAKKHYLQVTGEHFKQAVKSDVKSDAPDTT